MTNRKSPKGFAPFIAILFFTTLTHASPLKIMIDPGHGGSDQGASHNHSMEKNITLAVGLKLRALLDSDSRFSTIMTRSTDEFIPLDDRKLLAEKNKVDVFISIHVNSSPVASAGGTEIYFENQIPSDEESMFLANRENSSVEKVATAAGSPSDLPNILNDMNHSTHMTMSSVLAQKILEKFQSRLETKTRAIRQAPFRVLSVSMAATLIELGFITNNVESAKLKDPAKQKKMSEAIYQGLIAYKEKLDKIGPQP